MIYKVRTVYDTNLSSQEGIILSITPQNVEDLFLIVYIVNKKLRCSFFYVSKNETKKIQPVDKSLKEYFDTLFSGNIDYDDFYDLAQEWS